MKSQEKQPRKRAETDFIKKRILAIYGALSPVERAELLASAERIVEPNDENLSKSYPSSSELPRPKNPDADPDADCPVVKAKLLVDVRDEVTATPRGKIGGNRFFHVQVRCPNLPCQGLFYVPKIRLGRTTACPFCGQHVRVK